MTIKGTTPALPCPRCSPATGNTTPHPAMEPFVFFEDDRVKVSATLVDHAPAFPALAYRFDTDDGSAVFSGDTARSQNFVELAKDAEVLVHEGIDEQWTAALFREPRTEAEEGVYRHLVEAHSLISDIGPIAQEASATTLVLSRLVPGNAPDKVWEACAEGFDARLVIGRDPDVIGVAPLETPLTGAPAGELHHRRSLGTAEGSRRPTGRTTVVALSDRLSAGSSNRCPSPRPQPRPAAPPCRRGRHHAIAGRGADPAGQHRGTHDALAGGASAVLSLRCAVGRLAGIRPARNFGEHLGNDVR